LKEYDDETRAAVQHHLALNANDTFLWVALVVKELEEVESWNVEQVLEDVPTGLDELYARMMRQIQQLKTRDLEFCRIVLSAATLAYRPLHICELSMVSGLPEAISNKANIVQRIVITCGSFLTIREDRVFIIHQSAKDYLIGKATSTIFPSGHAEAHRGIFFRSLDAMRKRLRRDMYSLRHPGISIDDVNVPDPDPLASVQYSCVHWLDHWLDYNCEAQHQDDLRDGGVVYEFLQGFLLYWIEALSLCRAICDAVFAIAKVERLLRVSLEPLAQY
jgi:hypothetical protein